MPGYAPRNWRRWGRSEGFPRWEWGVSSPTRGPSGYISANYPGVQAIGGCADPLPDHPSGHAIDIMIGSDMGLGDAINADVQRHAERFGVAYPVAGGQSLQPRSRHRLLSALTGPQ